MKLHSEWKDTHTHTQNTFAATVTSLVHRCTLSHLTTTSYHYLLYYVQLHLYVLKSTKVMIHTHEDRQWLMMTTHFRHTCILWRSRTHIFWKCIALRHFVARNISDQPVMPFSKLGVLAAGSIRIWQFKSHNKRANTEICSACRLHSWDMPDPSWWLHLKSNFIYFVQKFFRMGTWRHLGFCLRSRNISCVSGNVYGE